MSLGTVPENAWDTVCEAAASFSQSVLVSFVPPDVEVVDWLVVVALVVDADFFFEPQPGAISSTPTRTAQINFSLMYGAPFQR
jgi:hypothetical protein